MIARSDVRARWAYGFPGLLLVVVLSACAIPMPPGAGLDTDPARSVDNRQSRPGVLAQRPARE